MRNWWQERSILCRGNLQPNNSRDTTRQILVCLGCGLGALQTIGSGLLLVLPSLRRRCQPSPGSIESSDETGRISPGSLGLALVEAGSSAAEPNLIILAKCCFRSIPTPCKQRTEFSYSGSPKPEKTCTRPSYP